MVKKKKKIIGKCELNYLIYIKIKATVENYLSTCSKFGQSEPLVRPLITRKRMRLMEKMKKKPCNEEPSQAPKALL